jgi:hypothetical protein
MVKRCPCDRCRGGEIEEKDSVSERKIEQVTVEEGCFYFDSVYDRDGDQYWVTPKRKNRPSLEVWGDDLFETEEDLKLDLEERKAFEEQGILEKA